MYIERVTTTHKSADCIAEVARLKNKAIPQWQDCKDTIERISPDLSTGDAEEMLYLVIQAMYTRDGFLEDIERIYEALMRKNYGHL
jgi:hypothetical protein